jgi:hypothetical protein
MNNVIILIPHFNNFSGLCNSIFSIEKDEKVDVLIVDDGSATNLIMESELLKFQKFNWIESFKIKSFSYRGDEGACVPMIFMIDNLHFKILETKNIFI